MKLIITVLTILLIIIGCTSDKDRLEGNSWLFKYHEYQVKNDKHSSYRSDFTNSNIYQFEEDTLKIKSFSKKCNNDILYTIYNSSSVPFMIDFQFYQDNKVYQDSFVIISKNDSSYSKSVYERLPAYNQITNRDKLDELLFNSTFKMDDVIFEFDDDYKILVNDLSHEIKSNSDWGLILFENELFLLIDRHDRILIHIKEVNETSFVGVRYGYENELRRFERFEPKDFDFNQLVGKWKSEKVTFRETGVWNTVETVHQELLDISKSGMILSEKPKLKSKLWYSKISKSQDLLLLSNEPNGKWKDKWKIESLSNEILVLESEGEYKLKKVMYKRIY